MKNITIIALILFGLTLPVLAQDFALKNISVNGGKQFSNFLFTTSSNQKDQTLSYQMYNAFTINGSFSSSKHTIRPELQIRQAGAKKSIQNTPVSWKMNYFNFNIGYGYALLQTDRFEVQTGAAFGLGYMLNGEQMIGNTRLSIIEEQSMNRFEISAHGFANLKTFISENLSLSLEYRFGAGLNHIENDISDQKTRNIFHSALLGIGINI